MLRGMRGMKEIYLKKNAFITCPKCSKKILKLTKDVYRYDTISAKQVDICRKYKNIYKKPKNGDRIKCFSCLEEYTTIIRKNEIEGVFKK